MSHELLAQAIQLTWRVIPKSLTEMEAPTLISFGDTFMAPKGTHKGMPLRLKAQGSRLVASPWSGSPSLS